MKEMTEEQKQRILSLIKEQATLQLEIMVEEGELDEVWNEDIDEMEWNMIEDGHWAVEEVFASVLGDDYDYNEVVDALFG